MTLREDVRKLVEHGDLEMGHARAILGLPETLQGEAAGIVVAKGLSVRQTEVLVRNMLAEPKAKPEDKPVSSDILHLEKDLSEKLGAQVAIQHTAKGKGKAGFKIQQSG